MKLFAFVLLVCTFVLFNIQISETCKLCGIISKNNNYNLSTDDPQVGTFSLDCVVSLSETNTMSSKPVAIAMTLNNALSLKLNTIYRHHVSKLPDTSTTDHPTSAITPTQPCTTTATPPETTAIVKQPSTTTAVPPTTTTVATTSENNNITPITCCDDVIQLFMSGNKLAELLLEDKQSAVLALTSYCGASYERQPLPGMVVINLVRMFAYTPELFPRVSGPVLNEVLTVATSDPCGGLFVSEQKIRERFVEGTLSLSAGVLYRVPKPAFTAVLDTAAKLAVSRPCTLPRTAVENLVTALSLSTTLFHCLPPTALEWVLRVTADHPNLWAQLPVSTTAAFMDGLLRAAAADRHASETRGRVPSVAAVLERAMTARLLGVLPAAHFDLLLESETLPVSVLEKMFIVLTTAPVQLNRVNPDYLARALLTVTSGSSSDSVTRNVITHLLNAMNEYSPKSMNRLPYEWRTIWSD